MSKPPNFSFVIMPIGRSDLELIYTEAICPAIKSVGLAVRRSDQHHEGGILNGEIIEFIQGAEILVADLTYARPNCYLEVGYGLSYHEHGERTRRNPRVILMARADHNKGHPDFKGEPNCVHFDLEAYGILWWKDVTECRRLLADELTRRLRLISRLPAKEAASPFDESWISDRRTTIRQVEEFVSAFVITSTIAADPPPRFSGGELLAAATAAGQEHRVGFVYTKVEFEPKGVRDGIRGDTPTNGGRHVWDWRTNGDFHRIATLAEDHHELKGREADLGKVIWFDKRIFEFVACLRYLESAYSRLGVRAGTQVHFRAAINGFSGRFLDYLLDALRWGRSEKPVAHQDFHGSVGHFLLGSLEAVLLDLLSEFFVPFGEMFDLRGEWAAELERIAKQQGHS